MTRFFTYLQLFFKLLIKSKEGWFWGFGFAIIMATGLGLMYNAIENVPVSVSNDVYTYAVYVEKETEKTPYILSFNDLDNFEFKNFNSLDEAKNAYEKENMTGYLVLNDTTNIYSKGDPDFLRFYLEGFEDTYTLGQLNIYPINDTIKRTELTSTNTNKNITGIEHMIIGMSLLAPFLAAGAYTKLRSYSDSNQFKRFEKGYSEPSKLMAIGFSSIVFSILSGITVLVYGMVVFKIHESASFNYGIYFLLIVTMSILALALRSFLKSLLLLLKINKNDIEDFVITFIGFLSGIYLITYDPFMMKYNPITISKFLLIKDGYNMSFVDVPLTRELPDLLIISAIITAVLFLGSTILRRIKK